MHREVGQPSGVRGSERGTVVGVGHQDVEVLLDQQGLDPPPSLGILLGRDHRVLADGPFHTSSCAPHDVVGLARFHTPERQLVTGSGIRWAGC